MKSFVAAPVVPAAAPSSLGQSYAERGFAVLGRVLGPDVLALVREEAVRICRGELGDIDGAAVPEPGEADLDVLRRYLCIHFPHKISPLLRGIASEPKVVSGLTEVIGPNIKLVQSMLFIKSEGRPGQAWHQDEAHIPTRDRSLTAAWIALDDATVENGCLWVIPGSHRPGVIFPTRPQDDVRFDCTDEAYDFGYREEDAVPVELPGGSVLVFDGYLLHRSLPNTGRHGMRRALVNHYMSAESLLPWFPPGNGEAMALLDHRDVLLVAGRDPYAAAGVTDIMRPHVRADRAGGCLR